ncbi:phosphoribosyl-AMP cyclohydrolase [Halomonas sp. Bachu 37]|uniref:phosphoribosyl-AMP cyclohydrolase n=1 Tax=Halomonas kashgarensis TaxID=3084920 RepID=UPI0032165278
MQSFFKEIESSEKGRQLALEAVLNAIKLNADGLIPAIAQQYDSGEVLMMAWMNREALEETLATGRVCYYSRSREKLWRKGESSGQQQHLKSAALDCDGDTLLLQVDQTGPACHTGRRSCFYVELGAHGATIVSDVMIDPALLYQGKKS